jgi:hypothetical protein
MRKHVAYAMAVAAFATTMSFSGGAFAANSLITPIDPGLKPAVEENCHDKKSYTRSERSERSGRRGRNNN